MSRKLRALDYLQPSDFDGWKKPGIRLNTANDVAPEKRKAAARRAARTQQQIRAFAEMAKGNGAPAPSFDRMSESGSRGGQRGTPRAVFRSLRIEGSEGKPPALEGYCSERCGQKAVINGLCRWHAKVFGEVA